MTAPTHQQQIEQLVSEELFTHSNTCSFPEGCDCGAERNKSLVKRLLTEAAQPLLERMRELESAYSVRNDEVAGLIEMNNQLHQSNESLLSQVKELEDKYYGKNI